MKFLTKMNDENMLDSLFDSLQSPFFKNSKNNRIMKTDVIEKEDNYLMLIDLPGFTKEQIKVIVDEGYLTVSATKNTKEDNYLYHERTINSCERTYYVGNIDQHKIKAYHNNGTLEVMVPKEKTPDVKSLEININ